MYYVDHRPLIAKHFWSQLWKLKTPQKRGCSCGQCSGTRPPLGTILIREIFKVHLGVAYARVAQNPLTTSFYFV